MPATVIPLERAGAWVAEMGAAMPQAAKRGLVAAAHRLVGALKGLELPTDRGVARAGWRAEEVEDGAAVFNGVLEAVLMEGGVRPEHVKVGRKMIDALAEWAKRKGLGSTYKTGRKRADVDFGGGIGSRAGKARTYQTVQRRVKPSDEALRSIAWAIAMKMKQRGIFSPDRGGLRPLERTTKTLGPEYVRQEVVREIRRAFL